MQLFIIDPCPKKCAQYLDNRRVGKIIIESAQLMSNALHFYQLDAPYKLTHKNHPLSIWVRQNRGNYIWTLQYCIALSHEYTNRFQRIHKTSLLIPKFINKINLIPAGERTPFVNCAANKNLNISFKHIPDVFQAYRMYLEARWENQ